MITRSFALRERGGGGGVVVVGGRDRGTVVVGGRERGHRRAGAWEEGRGTIARVGARIERTLSGTGFPRSFI